MHYANLKGHLPITDPKRDQTMDVEHINQQKYAVPYGGFS